MHRPKGRSSSSCEQPSASRTSAHSVTSRDPVLCNRDPTKSAMHHAFSWGSSQPIPELAGEKAHAQRDRKCPRRSRTLSIVEEWSSGPAPRIWSPGGVPGHRYQHHWPCAMRSSRPEAIIGKKPPIPVTIWEQKVRLQRTQVTHCNSARRRLLRPDPGRALWQAHALKDKLSKSSSQ